MITDIRNVLLTIIIILAGAISTSIIYAKQIEIEDISYYKAMVDAELARLEKDNILVSAENCIKPEEVETLVIARLKEIAEAENTTLVAEETAKNQILEKQQAAKTQAEVATLAALRVQQEEARLAAEKLAALEAAKIAAEKKALAQIEVEKAALLAAEQAAAKKASRQSRAS